MRLLCRGASEPFCHSNPIPLGHSTTPPNAAPAGPIFAVQSQFLFLVRASARGRAFRRIPAFAIQSQFLGQRTHLSKLALHNLEMLRFHILKMVEPERR